MSEIENIKKMKRYIFFQAMWGNKNLRGLLTLAILFSIIGLSLIIMDAMNWPKTLDNAHTIKGNIKKLSTTGKRGSTLIYGIDGKIEKIYFVKTSKVHEILKNSIGKDINFYYVKKYNYFNSKNYLIEIEYDGKRFIQYNHDNAIKLSKKFVKFDLYLIFIGIGIFAVSTFIAKFYIFVEKKFSY